MFRFLFIIIIFLSPISLNAQIIITEIMYNPESSDSGREWVEVYNLGSNSIDLSEYKLLENEINHGLSAYNEGEVILDSKQYAIIADNPAKFLEDYSQNGILLDSTFSLRNDGEQISIIDPDGQIINIVNYLPDWGANGTGNSLQLKNLSLNYTEKDWIPANPTPFVINATEAGDENNDSNSGNDNNNSDDNSSSQSTHSGINDISNYNPKVDFKISAGRDRYVTVNKSINFKLIHNQDSDNNIDVSWATGDGEMLRGLEVKYTYFSPGTYNLVANATFDSQNVTSRTKIYVSEPKIQLNYQKSGKHVDVMLKNMMNKEVNLGDYYVEYGSKKFKIAKDTIVSANSTLILSSKITKFQFSLDNLIDLIRLNYPNGDNVTQKKVEIDPIKDLDLILSLIKDTDK